VLWLIEVDILVYTYFDVNDKGICYIVQFTNSSDTVLPVVDDYEFRFFPSLGTSTHKFADISDEIREEVCCA
jgi:hypothetical protein